MFKRATASQSSLVDCIKNFDFKGVSEHLKKLNFNFVEMTTFFAVGVLAGFLCKRYFKSALVWALVGLVTVVALDYIGIVAIQWDTIQSAVGTSPADTFDMLFQQAVSWAKENVPVVISFIIGFTIGLKVG